MTRARLGALFLAGFVTGVVFCAVTPRYQPAAAFVAVAAAIVLLAVSAKEG